jgi:hypothetical protein
MSKLQDFLKTSVDVSQITAEVPLSDRFRDGDGKLLLFTIKAVTIEEYGRYQKDATVVDGDGNSAFDLHKMHMKVVVNHTVDPNFADIASIEAAGVKTPEHLVAKKLKTGEIDRLADEIMKLSGFGEDMDKLRKEAKNS